MSASAGDDAPSKQEVDQLIYSPGLAKTDTGRDLALQYLDYVEDEDPTKYGFKDRDEFNQWRDKLKQDFSISEGDINANNFVGGFTSDIPGVSSLEQDVYSAYSNAKAVYDQNQEGSRQADKKAADDAKGKLDEMAGRASATNAGANTSDEILDLGNAGMRTFDVFVPLFNRAVAAVGMYQPANKDDLYKLYNEQRKIPFTKFVAGADEFTKLKTAVADSSNDVKGQLATDLANWQGGAADQANAFQKNYLADAKTTADGMGHAADAVLAAVGSVGKACRDKANWVIKYRVDSLGPVTAQDLDRIIRIVELRSNASQDDFKHCAKFLDQQSQDLINDDDCNLNDDTISHIVDQCTQYLKDNFGKFFDGYMRDFKTMCANTHTAVDGAWKALSDFLLTLPEDPFADVGKSADDGGATKASSSSGGVNSGGGGGVNSGGGGGVNSGGAVPPPSASVGAPPKLPEVPDPNLNPVTHQALETNPETGQPYPIDPRTGAAIKTDTTAPESMTVEQGDHKIAMTEPGADGRMDIKVDDGSGSAKDYQLDFGQAKDGATPGATPADGTVPGTPQPGVPVHGTAPGGVAPGSTAPGGVAAGSTAPGGTAGHEPGAQPASDGGYRPGPDGKIHIEDGPLKITAEQPQGPGGPTVVTVDDGNGQPAKYTLGDDAAAAGGHGGAATAGDPAATGGHSATGDLAAGGATPGGHPGVTGHDPATPSGSAQPVAAAQDPASAHSVSGGHDQSSAQSFAPQGTPSHHVQSTPDTTAAQPAVGVPVAQASGPDNSTSAQSLADPMDSHSSVGGHEDTGLGAAVDSAGLGGGGATDPSESGLGVAPTAGDQHSQPASMGMMGGGMMGGGGGGGEQEQERSASPYRVDRGLFESSASGGRISGSLDDDSAIGSR
ncbi:MAG TPA: hypothetical protein VGH57_10730 [Amycolatopsis sp.]